MTSTAIRHLQPRANNRPQVSTSSVDPILAGWGHCIVKSSSLSTSPIDRPGNIYLGPQQCAAASSLPDLHRTDPPIHAIVNCTNAYPNHHESNGVKYCRVPINDEDKANILIYLDGTSKFIHHYVSRGQSVLVHCQMGISRSATVVIAYLMTYHSMSRDEAYQYVKERRPQIEPNHGFWQQLEVFEHRLAAISESDKSNKAFDEKILLDKTWVQQSIVKYQTIRHILDDEAELFPEIDVITTDPLCVLSTSLDYIFGRGVLEADLQWFSVLCRVVQRLMKDCDVTIAVDLILSGEDGSEFAENWIGEISARDMERVKASICN